jgi:hypothetical protein
MELGTILTVVSISALILTIVGLSVRDWILARRAEE